MIYKSLNDEDNQIATLIKAIETDENYYMAYDVLGKIYYNSNLYFQAKKIFEETLKIKNINSDEAQYYLNQIGNIDEYSQYKALTSQADTLLISGKYLKALNLYEFLIFANYNTSEIYKNAGICNFKLGNFKTALKYFINSKIIDKNKDIYLYIALTYDQLKLPDEALNILEEAKQTIGNDPQIVKLYNQIQQEINKTK